MTPTPEILTVALYTGLNALIFLWLTAHVGNTRRRLGISIGDGGNPQMLRAMRGQANFVECVPLALIVMLMAALIGTPTFVLHGFGIVITLSRVFHAMHFTKDDAPGWSRAAGSGLTLIALFLGAAGLTAHVLWQMVTA